MNSNYSLSRKDLINKIFQGDCIEYMKQIEDNTIDFILTDIPYDAVSRFSNGLRNLDKENADIITFDLEKFCQEVYRIAQNSVCIFCGKEQFSFIFDFFANKKGTTRAIIWNKTNPSPMNGQYVYLSGVELAVWYKKKGAKTFNAHCKNTVFNFPNGRRKYHPTEKNIDLFKELISDNTNEGDLVFDPCMGSGTTAIAAIDLKRKYCGIELDKNYYQIIEERINNHNNIR